MNNLWGLLTLVVIFPSVIKADNSLPSSENGEIKTSIGVSSRYFYNVFYDSDRAVSDELISLIPEIKGQTRPSSFYLDGDLKGVYERFFTQTIQNHFDYDGSANININEEGAQSYQLAGRYHAFSDPSPNETYGRLNRTQMDGTVKGKFKGEKGNSFEVKVHYNSEDFVNPTFTSQTNVDPHYLANSTADGLVQYNYAFLPETEWIFRGSGGSTQYPLSNYSLGLPRTTLDPSTEKTNSIFGMVETGVLGRLTEKSTIDFATGYLYRAYTDNYGFSGPVFYIHFTEQVTRRDQLMAGYNYVVKDSYWTDYYLDQEIYLGLARVIGDQLIVLTRLAYSYRSFSLPNRRDDERIIGSLMIKYSLNRNIKLTADVKMDLLVSDAYNTSTQTSPPQNPDGSAVKFLDNPVSYKAGSLGLGLVATF